VLLTVYIGLFPAIGSTLCWNEAVRRLGAGTPGSS
jgi:drug/metabolite transporter (DMT)-like permease